MRLLVLDLDQTLALTPPVPLSPDGAPQFDAWHALILQEHHEAHPIALQRIPALAADAGCILILTARSIVLLNRTLEWLDREFPELGGAAISMRPVDCLLPSAESKLLRLREFRLLYPGEVTIVDDDPAMAAGADRFVRAWG